MARTSQKDLNQMAAHIENVTGLSVMVGWAYGLPRLESGDGSREISPRLPSGQLLDWMRAFLAGWWEREKMGRKGRGNPRTRRTRHHLSVPEQHQLKVARQTLKYSDAGARIMGGPTKAEAQEIIRRLTGREPQENPGDSASLARSLRRTSLSAEHWPIRIDVRMPDPLDAAGTIRTYSYFGYVNGDRKRVLNQKLRQARKAHPTAVSIEVLADDEALR